MPSLIKLIELAQSRGEELVQLKQSQESDLRNLDAEVAAKREEKTIAAQNDVKELLKKKEAMMKDAKYITGACALIDKAVAKLKRASSMGLDDWQAIHEEGVPMTDFVTKRIKDEPSELEKLKKICGGAELTVQGSSIHFAGNKDVISQLKTALIELESGYEEWLDTEDEDTLSLIEVRGELTRLAKKHGVNVSREGQWVHVSGSAQGAKKVSVSIKGMMSGKQDIDCPKNLTGAAKAKSKDVEPETGAIIEVQRAGGWDDIGIIYIRGEEECVKQAGEIMQAWLDEREGFKSEFINVAKEPAKSCDTFSGDLAQMGGWFGVAVRGPKNDGTLELRGPPQKVKDARGELDRMLNFYRQK